ncbi:hypothetical protein [Providencia huaxiensis]|uniref:hypothetical protein n=1 Tax=Providencia huaxiensis TaxID=2027290 RepID=UPI0034DD6754
MDSIDTSVPSLKGEQVYGVPESQAAWYASQMFIGNICAPLLRSTGWWDKACKYQAKGVISHQGIMQQTQRLITG